MKKEYGSFMEAEMFLLENSFELVFSKINNEDTFNIFYNEQLKTVCSVAMQKGSTFCFIACPYLEENVSTSFIRRLNDIVKNVSFIPLREITLADLPLLSPSESDDIEEMVKGISTKRYFNCGSLDDDTIFEVRYFIRNYITDGENEINIGDIENLLKKRRLNYMPDKLKELVGYEYQEKINGKAKIICNDCYK